MHWLYKILMAVSMIGAGAVSGGLIPPGFGALFTAVGTAAALFHSAPGNGNAKDQGSK